MFAEDFEEPVEPKPYRRRCAQLCAALREAAAQGHAKNVLAYWSGETPAIQVPGVNPTTGRRPSILRLFGGELMQAQARVLMHGYMHLGGTLRRCQLLAEAELAFREAQRVARSLPEADRSDLASYLALLRFDDGTKQAGALRRASDAIEWAEKSGDPVRLARALLARGQILVDPREVGVVYDTPSSLQAVGDLRCALELTDGERFPLLYYATVTVLCRALFVGAGRAEDLGPILRLLDAGPPGRRHSVLRARTLWLRGMILARFGAVRHAVRLLERAYRDFVRIGHAQTVAQVALDLGILYSDLERWQDLHRVAADAVFLFREGLSRDMLSVVLLWRDSVLHGDADDEVVAKARASLAGGPAGEVGIPPTPPPTEEPDPNTSDLSESYPAKPPWSPSAWTLSTP